MPETYETLKIDRPDPHVLVVTLNRPEAMNAFNTRMGEEMRVLFRDYDHFQTPDLRCVIITGAGDRAFCTGGDLKERRGMTDEAWRRQHIVFEEKNEAVWRFPVPIIAAVNGFALGGGCEVALACDFIYASEKASFGLPEVTRGIMPGNGGTQRLPRRIGIGRAKELLYTGRIIDAKQALEWGLVNRLCAPDKLMEEALATAKQIAKSGPIGVRQVKKAVDRGAYLPLESGLMLEIEAYQSPVFSEDRHEGINAFNEKRPPVWKNK
jgi:enoyl-CoA hydratase/carnithine racemase